MPEQNVHKPKRVVVVGGGVSGLAAAHRVLELSRQTQQPVDIKLLEARDRLGGTILTQHREGFLIEGGPDSFITQKPWGLALCKRIGIDDQLIATNPDCRRTFVVRAGKLHAVPEGFLLLAPTKLWPMIASKLFSWHGKIRMGMDLILPARDHGTNGDESLSSFVRRRLGQEALDRIAQPMVSGIYTADPENLSLRATMPRFLEMEQNHRSLILAMRRGRKAASQFERGDSGARYSLFVSFKRGMSTLIDELASRLDPGTIQTDAPVSAMNREADTWQIESADGSTQQADAVILACPAYASADIVRKHDGTLADELSAISYASSATMTMAFRREQVPHPLDGFGFVVPAIENRTLIAATFSSVKFADRAPAGWLLIRAFLGGATHPHVYEMQDDQLRKGVLADLRGMIGLTGEPAFTELSRWPKSMPQYPVGHLDHVKRIENHLAGQPGLAVAGNAFGGVGVPDCVHSGESAAENIMSVLSPVTPV